MIAATAIAEGLPLFTTNPADYAGLDALVRIIAGALRAEGIVGVQLRQHSHTWGSHTTEFFAISTAVRPLGDDHVIERPTMVLSLDA